MKTTYFFPSRRLSLGGLAIVAIVLLMLKILASILIDYRYYFPPNFDATFLMGREAIFVSWYRVAFYVHILVSPVCLGLAAFLVLSGQRFSRLERSPQRIDRLQKRHRYVGRIQSLLVLLLLVPSGIVMAQQAMAGPIAVVGFTGLSIATAVTLLVAIRCAMQRNFPAHRRWAWRCFILLLSPLILRFANGALLTAQWESNQTYRYNAWLSWLVPLLVYEIYALRQQLATATTSFTQQTEPIR